MPQIRLRGAEAHAAKDTSQHPRGRALWADGREESQQHEPNPHGQPGCPPGNAHDDNGSTAELSRVRVGGTPMHSNTLSDGAVAGAHACRSRGHPLGVHFGDGFRLSFAVGASVLIAALPASGITFPSSGYGTIRLDGEDPDVPDNVDIVAIGYQTDGTYGYFKITVAGTAGFSSDRFYLYLDLDGDGLADRLLRETSAVNATLDSWSASQEWEAFGPAWSEDPNDAPDDHVYLGCRLSDINGGNFVLLAAAQDQPLFEETIRDPHLDPNMDEVVGSGSSNPTMLAVWGFGVERRRRRLFFSWQAGPRPDLAGFNVYALLRGGGQVRLNKRLIPARPPFGDEKYDVVCDGGRYDALRCGLEVVSADGRSRVAAAVRWPPRWLNGD